MRRSYWLAAAVVCALALSHLPAFAARATTSFDAIETELVARQDALEEPLDRTTKKTAKLYARSLEKLVKDTDSLKSEIKRGAQVLGKLSKLDDPDVTALVDEALVALAEEVFDAIDEAQIALDSALAKVPQKKVQKQIDGARSLTSRSLDASSAKKRLRFLQKAESKARRALALAAKVRPVAGGGGGGGESCPGRLLKGGESVTITLDAGGSFRVDSINFDTVEVGDKATTTISFYDCTGDDPVVVNVILPAPTPAGSYSGSAENPAAVVSFSAGAADAVLTETLDGSAELTRADARLVMTFEFTLNGVLYEGTVDADARNR